MEIINYKGKLYTKCFSCGQLNLITNKHCSLCHNSLPKIQESTEQNKYVYKVQLINPSKPIEFALPADNTESELDDEDDDWEYGLD